MSTKTAQQQISKTKHLTWLCLVSTAGRILYNMYNSQMVYISPSHISGPAKADFYKSNETLSASYHKNILSAEKQAKQSIN